MIKFTKMQGLGNDYVYIERLTGQNIIEENLQEFIQKTSNRNFGVGSDGVIFIDKSDVADFKMTMYNQDGSQAEMCGNGIRCVGKFVYDKGFTKKQKITVETLAGIKVLTFTIQNGKVEKVKVDMGEPILIPEEIPVIANKELVTDLNLQVEDKDFKFTCVSMGNPHAITFIKDNVKEFDINKYGKIVESDNHFPNKTNVEFINIVDKSNIKMRVWERGAGETLACGTGACASAVAAVLNEFTERKVNVELLGGILEIEWDKENNHVYMTGTATTVFEGEI